MNKNKLQQGSAHLIIIIVLSVVLLGTLGLVFWQNFMKPESSIVDDTSLVETDKIASSEVALTEIATDKIMGTKLAIKYPKTWTATYESSTEDTLGTSSDKNTITSPDGTTSVVLHIFSSTGRGIPCGGNTSPVNIIDTGAIAGFPAAGFVQYDGADQYTSENGIFIGAYKLDIVEGKTDCASYDEAQYLLGYLSQKLATLKATVVGDINSDNYKIAKRIIQSLYIKG